MCVCVCFVVRCELLSMTRHDIATLCEKSAVTTVLFVCACFGLQSTSEKDVIPQVSVKGGVLPSLCSSATPFEQACLKHSTHSKLNFSACSGTFAYTQTSKQSARSAILFLCQGPSIHAANSRRICFAVGSSHEGGTSFVCQACWDMAPLPGGGPACSGKAGVGSGGGITPDARELVPVIVAGAAAPVC